MESSKQVMKTVPDFMESECIHFPFSSRQNTSLSEGWVLLMNRLFCSAVLVFQIWKRQCLPSQRRVLGTLWHIIRAGIRRVWAWFTGALQQERTWLDPGGVCKESNGGEYYGWMLMFERPQGNLNFMVSQAGFILVLSLLCNGARFQMSFKNISQKEGLTKGFASTWRHGSGQSNAAGHVMIKYECVLACPVVFCIRVMFCGSDNEQIVVCIRPSRCLRKNAHHLVYLMDHRRIIISRT